MNLKFLFFPFLVLLMSVELQTADAITMNSMRTMLKIVLSNLAKNSNFGIDQAKKFAPMFAPFVMAKMPSEECRNQASILKDKSAFESIEKAKDSLCTVDEACLKEFVEAAKPLLEMKVIKEITSDISRLFDMLPSLQKAFCVTNNDSGKDEL